MGRIAMPKRENKTQTGAEGLFTNFALLNLYDEKFIIGSGFCKYWKNKRFFRVDKIKIKQPPIAASSLHSLVIVLGNIV